MAAALQDAENRDELRTIRIIRLARFADEPTLREHAARLSRRGDAGADGVAEALAAFGLIEVPR